jgi:inner membrane protein
VIRVSPIGVVPFFSRRGWDVLRSELAWIWAPAGVVALVGGVVRRMVRAG